MKIIDVSSLLTPEDLEQLTPNAREYVYNGLDCCITLEIFEKLSEDLDANTQRTYQRSLDLRGPVLEMALRGLRIDEYTRLNVVEKKKKEKEIVEQQLQRIITEGIGLADFNYRSPVQVKNLFYTVLRIQPIKKRNSKGIYEPSVDRDSLEKIALHFMAEPIAIRILALRDLDKQLEFLTTKRDADKRLRSTINIAGTKTGRFSSSISEFGTGRNSQNIDRSLRSVIIPDPGFVLVNIDLEQGDSRNMGAMMYNVFYKSHGADFAGSYLRACESADLHTSVSKMVWPDLGWTGNPPEDRKIAEQLFYRQDSYRQTTKKVGHATNYGGQAPHVAKATKIPVRLIQIFQENYFAGFPVIPAYHEWIKRQLRETQQITTLYGRRRTFYGRYDDRNVINEALAFPSQSMTADAVNEAMIRIAREKLPIQFLLQVHDSLLFQVPEKEVTALVPEILRLGKVTIPLVDGTLFSVPNEAKVGYNWGDQDSTHNPQGLRKWKGSWEPKKQTKYGDLLL